uniref:SOUL heme-binding protein n=1 Tax=Chrysotila carterae TaxID=13221 RepID=A0A7S4BQM8_CHRCT
MSPVPENCLAAAEGYRRVQRPISLCARLPGGEWPSDAAKSMLLKFGGAGTPKEEKEEMLRTLQELDPVARAEQLDAALRVLDGLAATNRWAMRRWPLRLPSKRVALGCYARLLDQMSAREPGSGGRMQEGGDSRRRRFLLALLRESVDTKGVYALEGQARQRQRRGVTMEEMLARTPADLETPTYEVLDSRPTWEVRKYDDFTVCSTDPTREVSADGMRVSAPSMGGAGAFQALAGYIFGSNERNEKMAMTTPVLSRTAADGGRKMSFVLPSRYWQITLGAPQASLADSEAPNGVADTQTDSMSEVDEGDRMLAKVPPAPKEASGVQLEDGGGGFLESSDVLAVVWFDGYAGKGDVDAQQRQLRALVDVDSEWEAVPDAQPTLMQYNDPFVLPWKRRNEVAIPVRKRQVVA